MKKIMLIVVVVGGSYFANAQVGIGTPNPDSNAMLEIKSANKGVLIPRMELKSLTSSEPISSGNDLREGLLVYNISASLPVGFYSWDMSGKKWLKLQSSNDYDLLNYLVPSNPNANPNAGLTHTSVVYDSNAKKFYTVTYDPTTRKYIREEMNMDELIATTETATKIQKAVVVANGELPAFVDSDVKPVAADVKVGDVFYEYKGEDGLFSYINLSADVQNIIQNNQTIKNEITNIVEKGGNVYYTETGIDNIPAKSLYEVLPDKTKKEIKVGGSNTVINNGDTIITGDKIDGKDVLMIKKAVKVTNATTDGVDVGRLPDGKTKVAGVQSIVLYKNGLLVATAFTDLRVANTRIDFNLGQGSMYMTLPTGNYDAIIQFTAE